LGEFDRLTGDRKKEIRVKRIIDISDAKVSRDPADELITYSLGSCIGVALYDGATGVGGMLHFQLPSSKQNSGSSDKPHMYADTGMACVLKKMVSLGADKKRINIKVAGGAQMLAPNDMFHIGKRNYAAIRQILWKNGMFIAKQDIGGSAPRNLLLKLKNGAVVVQSRGQKRQL